MGRATDVVDLGAPGQFQNDPGNSPRGGETGGMMAPMVMDTRAFTECLRRLGHEEIERAAARLCEERATAAGEVTWWEDTLMIQGILRTHRASRHAARHAHDACTAVQRAAQASGFELPDEVVTAVARAAAEVARALVAEAVAGDGAIAVVDRMMAVFEPIDEAPLAVLA